MTIEATAPEVAPAMKESINVDVWLLWFRDWERGRERERELGGPRISVKESRTVS